MTNTNRPAIRILKVLAFVALVLPAVACGPGNTVYVGVAAPGPWVGYPPGGVYGGYPGRYGRPWYSPEEAPQAPKAQPEGADAVAPDADSSTVHPPPRAR